MRNSNQRGPKSRESETRALVELINAASTLDDCASCSIVVGDPARPVATWIPSSVLGERCDSPQLWLHLVHTALRPLAKAEVELLSGESCHVIIRALAHVDSSTLDASIGALAEWIVAQLDCQVLTIETIQADGATQATTWEASREQPAEDKILTAGPLIGPREAKYTLSAARYGWNDQHSEYLTRFEADFAQYVGVSHTLATSSCTGALHLALLALGVGPGDEVVVPETTWVASGAAVRYVGATPVFADVDPVTWTITPETIMPCLSERTRVVLPVHLYGYPADMPRIVDLAESKGLMVLEDAAPAIGALVDGRPVGSFGDMAAFSFQGAKMLVTGEGGMLVTNRQDLRDRAWKQQDHGRVPGTFWIDELGRKYKMPNITAAFGLAQLESVETQIVKKRRINGWYREHLAGTPGISFQEEGPGSRSICWMTSIVVDQSIVTRTAITEALRAEGIDTRHVFPPISAYPIWGAKRGEPGAVASRLGSAGINLPSGVRLSRASVARVAEVIDRVVRNGE